jgi:hypothetical protein
MMRRALVTCLVSVVLAVISLSGAPAEAQILCGYCCDGFGNIRCGGNMALPCGSSCFCPGMGYGFAC